MASTVFLESADVSEKFAIRLASAVVNFFCANQTPLILGFSGEIGMGKTTIIRKLLEILGVSDKIKSPTYAIVETYNLESINLHHFDLYRIQDESELDYIGFRDYFMNNSLCCIEWPENLGGYALDLDVLFTISRCGDGRVLNIDAKSPRGLDLIKSFIPCEEHGS